MRAQSLAEVAQQEEERRKTVKPAGKVLTNKDLGDVPPAAVAPPADAAGGRQGGRSRENRQARGAGR